jgi:hypothetical protein
MAPIEKERVSSLILSVATTSTTVATIAGNISKISAPEIFKLDSFVGIRFKFKAFYI